MADNHHLAEPVDQVAVVAVAPQEIPIHDPFHFLTQPCSASCQCLLNWHSKEPEGIVRVASKFRNPARMVENRVIIQGLLGAHCTRRDVIYKLQFFIENFYLCKLGFLRVVNITEDTLQLIKAEWLELDSGTRHAKRIKISSSNSD
jgi:hypothetical protein